uniref:Uncharacterized protein n=1 Tax=Oryza barthii TaxID=65489 RepID=A0A0D3G6B2_9ORYZ
MAVATDDDEDVEEMQGYRIGRIGSASCKEDRLDQMGSAVGTRVPSSGVGKVTIDRARRAAATDCRPGEPLRSPLMGMEAFDTAAASPSSMYDGARCSSNRFLGVEFQNCTDAVMLIPGIAGFLPCDSLRSAGRHCSRPRGSSWSHGVASRNCVQWPIAVDLETNIWPSLNFAPSSIPPASDKQDIGRSQNASSSCRLVFFMHYIDGPTAAL